MEDRNYAADSEASDDLRDTLELIDAMRADPKPIPMTLGDLIALLCMMALIGACIGIVMLTGKPLFG